MLGNVLHADISYVELVGLTMCLFDLLLKRCRLHAELVKIFTLNDFKLNKPKRSSE